MSAPAEAIGDSAAPPAAAAPPVVLAVADQPAALGQLQGQPARLLEFLDLPGPVRRCRCSPNSSPTTSRWSSPTTAASTSRSFKSYPETAFGGEFETETDYRDPYLKDQITAAGGTHHLAADPLQLRNHPPRLAVAGTVAADRRELARHRRCRPRCHRAGDLRFPHFHPVRPALTILSSAIGIVAGAVQGYFGGLVDLLTQRFIEIWSSLPSLFILIIIAAVLPRGFWILLGILLLFSWTSLVGLVRAEFLRGRNLEYVRAAKALGLGDWQVMFKHILPNAMVSTITFLPFITSSSVTALTALDFLGLGLPIGSASLGESAQPGSQAQPDGTLARHHRVRRRLGDAEPARLHRRSGARCT